MIIELIGLAGAGKSTLTSALSERIDHAELESEPYYKRLKDIPFFIRNSFTLFPTLSYIYLHKNGRFPSKDELNYLLILNGWHQILKQKTVKKDKILILDQGPVFMLTFLALFRPVTKKSNNLRKWWEHSVCCWAETLDLVIWLDTSLQVLLERIRGREIWHGAKDKSDDDAYKYLKSYRQAYESVISKMLLCSNSFEVLRIDTGENSLEETMDIVIDALNLESSLLRRKGINKTQVI